MITTLIGTKKGMTSSYDMRGRRVGATIVEVTPNYVVGLKTADSKDGYNAVQIAAGTSKSVKKPQVGLYKKVNAPENLRWVREIRTDDMADLTVGQELKTPEVLKKGDLVKATATSKGKGFAGVVKRYHFAGGPKTHGQSDRHRSPGSIGAGSTPGRVFKGKRMSGHMGMDTVSYTGLEIISIDKESNLVLVKGGIPGPIGGMVMLQKQGQVKGYVEPVEEVVEEEVVEETTEVAEEAPADAPEETTEESTEEVAATTEEAPATEESEPTTTEEIASEDVVENDQESEAKE